MKAKTITIEYEPGEYYITQGHKKNERKHRNSYGQYVNPTGYGWGTVSKSSKLTVNVIVNEKHETVLVDRYFKENLGRLTTRRIDAIERTMPEFLEIEGHTNCYGDEYFIVNETSMEEWLTDVEAILN